MLDALGDCIFAADMRERNTIDTPRVVGHQRTGSQTSVSHQSPCRRSGVDAIDPRATCAVNRSVLPHGIDARRRDAKRLAEIARDLAARLPQDPDLIARTRITGAALLVMRIEVMAAAQARSEAIDANDLVRIHHALARALGELGLAS